MEFAVHRNHFSNKINKQIKKKKETLLFFFNSCLIRFYVSLFTKIVIYYYFEIIPISLYCYCKLIKY